MLILSRHGNTFEANQTPVWVGARTDLPLTAEGMAQADRVARWIQSSDFQLQKIISGPLKRTLQLSEVVSKATSLPVTVDNRLRELDYGLWEGLSGDQIREKFGPEELEGWEKLGAWPKNAGWPDTEQIVRDRLAGFLQDMHAASRNQDIFACTSNGILRLMRSMITGQQGTWVETRVLPGRVCQLETTDKSWTITRWNDDPATLLSAAAEKT
ncbi:MAG: histidine phosphatase family protein [Pseudomonadota bacterium]|nr:histidine phosphatase family protein [Pseudomonadota bacterium]